MPAVAIGYKPAKGFVLVHRCANCGFTRRNRVADDDDLDMLIELMQHG
jgi:hypothetical protein